ncbi:hypothetical protein BFJ66_g17931 [Fusarium oxysporum f. sp. cepae]|uniref:Uncharacterized protein n=1 Tax=Fusarium oxysporum f. sp. cepae TaxID=396571 RepID=A0A3L6MU48_FUSOX|nr:hypothetical protein BFJ65_g17765 [Fusarium oxysporum f. sp. cepae]RKK15584.1 hypothetical protein BFJ67_g17876 [Fusarium oxysporum f. sp. cepae]RKK17340.1 hypothetical protein BFJ66_g17931 [Fusarium oxysporum f. sp. cepae]
MGGAKFWLSIRWGYPLGGPGWYLYHLTITVEIDWDEPEDAQDIQQDADVNDDDGSTYSDSDISMFSASRPASPAHLPPESSHPPPVQSLQALRKGYTLLVDGIQAYRVYRRYNKIMDHATGTEAAYDAVLPPLLQF